jgi:hypothetical protein
MPEKLKQFCIYFCLIAFTSGESPLNFTLIIERRTIVILEVTILHQVQMFSSELSHVSKGMP